MNEFEKDCPVSGTVNGVPSFHGVKPGTCSACYGCRSKPAPPPPAHPCDSRCTGLNLKEFEKECPANGTVNGLPSFLGAKAATCSACYGCYMQHSQGGGNHSSPGPSTGQCFDNPNFRDMWNYPCPSWAGMCHSSVLVKPGQCTNPPQRDPDGIPCQVGGYLDKDLSLIHI